MRFSSPCYIISIATWTLGTQISKAVIIQIQKIPMWRFAKCSQLRPQSFKLQKYQYYEERNLASFQLLVLWCKTLKLFCAETGCNWGRGGIFWSQSTFISFTHTERCIKNGTAEHWCLALELQITGTPSQECGGFYYFYFAVPIKSSCFSHS